MAGFGNTYNFNHGAYIDVGSSEHLNSLEKMTFSSWIKLNSTGKDQGVFGKSTSSNTGFYLIVQSNNLLKFSVKTQDGIDRRIYSNQALQADKWYHIDVMYDGKDLMIFIDGELDNIKTTYQQSSQMLHDPGVNMYIGNAYGLKFDGEIDEAMLWDRPLSVTQVREIMSIRPDSQLPGLVSYWPISEGFLTTTKDLAGVNNGNIISGNPSYWTESSAPLFKFMGTDSIIESKLVGDEEAGALYNITTDPNFGSVELIDASTGEFKYTPNPGTEGIDDFRYSISYGDYTTPEKIVKLSVKDSNSIEDNSITPASFELFQNYPNPFNPVTQIMFALAKSGDVKLSVYNISGQIVSELAKGVMDAGYHAVEFDGGRLNSGVYYYTLEVDGKTMAKKMVLTK